VVLKLSDIQCDCIIIVVLVNQNVGHFFHPIRYLMIGSAHNVIFALFDLFHIHSNGAVDYHPEISRTPGHVAVRALATSDLVGIQPVLTQVPLNNLRSIAATFNPAPANLADRDSPA